jgi:hypothetical protein
MPQPRHRPRLAPPASLRRPRRHHQFHHPLPLKPLWHRQFACALTTVTELKRLAR